MEFNEAIHPESGTTESGTGGRFAILLLTLLKNWPVVAAATILGAGAGLLITKLTPPVYQASATVEFDPNAVRPLSEKSDGFSNYVGFLDNQTTSETQYKVMVSDRVLVRVAQTLNLATDSSFLGAHGPVVNPVPLTDVAAILRGRVAVEAIKNTRLFKVKVEDGDPKRARRLCDIIVSTYISQNAENSMSATSDAVAWLNGQVDHYRSELEGDENALHEFKRKNELPSTSINEASNMLRLEMQSYAEALTKTRTQLEEMSARAAELAKVNQDHPEEVPASELLSDLYLQGLRQAYTQAVREERELAAEGRGDNHPAMKRARERVSETRSALLAEIRNIQGAVLRDQAILVRQEAGERGLYEGARKRAVDLNMKEIEYRRLDRSREENEKLYVMLIERMKEADLSRMMNVSNVRLLDSAVEPKGAIRPVPAANFGLGIVGGFVTGCLLAWLRLLLDTSIKTPDDVAQHLGVPFLGLLPELLPEHRARRKASRRSAIPVDSPSELMAHNRPTSELAEAARTIRTNLMFMNPDKPFGTLLVSSAAPGEGKTTVACSISIALAQSGRRVCIVDCDLRRPRLHKIFDRVGDAGVTNVIIGESTIAAVAKPTGIDGLFCIPSGPMPPNPADLFHSERFREFIRELGQEFENVVIDSPPVAAVTDSVIISTLTDACVFVTRAFKTSRHVAKHGLAALANVESRVAGVVLNAVDLTRAEYSYRHVYYYYRSEGQSGVQVTTPLMAAEDDSRSAHPPVN